MSKEDGSGGLTSLREEAGSIVKVDPGAVAAAEGAKARIQSAYIMAYKNPRNVDDARMRILDACKRGEFAKTVEYSKPIAGIKIKGKSIRYAEEAARAFRNILTNTYVVYEDDRVRRVSVIATDLEANISHSAEITITRTVERKKPSEDREIISSRTNTEGQKVFIVAATDEEVQTKENNLVSKVLRNLILRLIPSDIQEESVKVAHETIAKDIKQDPAAAKKQILDAFHGIGLWPKDIEAYLGHKIDSVSPKELEDLREVHASIKTGESTWKDFLDHAREEGAGTGGGSGPGEEKAPELTEEEKAKVKAFDGAVPKDINKELFDEFLKDSAGRMKKTLDQLKILALGDWQNFWSGFNRFMSKQKKSGDAAPGAGTATEKGAEKKSKANAGPSTTDPAANKESGTNVVMVACPERTDTQMTETFCKTQCFKAEECKPFQNLLAGRGK